MARQTPKQNAGNPTTTRAAGVLQHTVDDLCARINDDPSRSLRTRLLRNRALSAKAKEAILTAVEEAVAECRNAVTKEGVPQNRPSRVNVADLE